MRWRYLRIFTKQQLSFSSSGFQNLRWRESTETHSLPHPVILSRISVSSTGSTVHITKHLLECLHLFKFGFQKLAFVLKVNFEDNDWKLRRLSYQSTYHWAEFQLLFANDCIAGSGLSWWLPGSSQHFRAQLCNKQEGWLIPLLKRSLSPKD